MALPMLALGTPLIAGFMRQALSTGVKQGVVGKALQKFLDIQDKIGPFGYGFLYAGGTVQGYHLNSAMYNKPFKYIGTPRRISKL